MIELNYDYNKPSLFSVNFVKIGAIIDNLFFYITIVEGAIYCVSFAFAVELVAGSPGGLIWRLAYLVVVNLGLYPVGS